MSIGSFLPVIPPAHRGGILLRVLENSGDTILIFIYIQFNL
jgi:hypothetical protein